MVSNLYLLYRTTHHVVHRLAQPPPLPLFDHRPPQYDSGSMPLSRMGNDGSDKGQDIHSEETILFLFLAFGILIVLILVLLLLGFQTYLSYRIAHLLIEADTNSSDKHFRRWHREREERKRTLRMLEKGKRAQESRDYRSGSRPWTVGADEEIGMSGARGESVMFEKLTDVEPKKEKAFWSLKRYM